MKEKIITLVLGILIGAVLTAGSFLIFGNNSKDNMPDRGNMQMQKDGNFIPGDFKDKDQVDSLETNTDTETNNI